MVAFKAAGAYVFNPRLDWTRDGTPPAYDVSETSLSGVL